MKVEVNETLLKEFGHIYNMWNDNHEITRTLDASALANMAIAKAVMVMREHNDKDEERRKYRVDRKHVEEYCNAYNRKIELEGKPNIMKIYPDEAYANHAIVVATSITEEKVRELEEQACTK